MLLMLALAQCVARFEMVIRKRQAFRRGQLSRGKVMNWTKPTGNWNELKGRIKTTWGRLTDADLMQAAGQKDRLAGMIQQRYGISRDQAEQQLDEFISASEGWLTRAKSGATDVVAKGKEVIEKSKDYVQNTSVSQMASDLKELIGRRPIHSAVIGVGLGFVIGRLLTSSNRS
jgi:uncharacterized protein YjbJ (UPF0337 family)